MYDIAICGKDTRFCRMLELELQAWGYTVSHNPHGDNHRLWIVDLDTVPLPANHTDRLLIGITREESSLPAETRQLRLTIVHRPIRMETFREQIARLLSPTRALPRVARTHARLRHTSDGFFLDGEPLTLTDTEEQVLQALYDRRGEPVSRTELCSLLGSESNDKLADVYICLLRKKLEANGTPRLLFTVRGVGYRLETEKFTQ